MVGALRQCAVRANKKATTQGPRRLGPIGSCVAITALIWRSPKRLNRPAGERRGRDSNPRYRFKPVHRFSKPTPSASRPPLHNRINIDAGPIGFNWRRGTVIRGLVGCRTKPLHGHAGFHTPQTRGSGHPSIFHNYEAFFRSSGYSAVRRFWPAGNPRFSAENPPPVRPPKATSRSAEADPPPCGPGAVCLVVGIV